ncbi:helix-turn-helix transcriptional regulator [Pandoraea nosoerga]|uniref:ArsR family transcriptional regulator n=1 Tax=Pandoraea nosoerga TaxID=2508296 RepID=A0A5E4W8P5_9BURK|nr:metalloregulator ArsR/SmtB family transcription factor [Pandoraea nosoerga]MBN4666307.1 helix-turn-helix transcriptional regulator [Pandoraea nosoerga]MBN4676013.1 helix-turn-helix transcriptional regulator [Pandoraea nosoerga]MBN4682108.1 helix-turn-helix transcriptional regulator [Pandoraea nosoerga]MBN4747206.1 helix-turn-helix transcriptional regulator [Pandoraea nosoerga]VVE20249.1 ArsR family transcriptional regulator [Pandoraea nosoerga]
MPRGTAPSPDDRTAPAAGAATGTFAPTVTALHEAAANDTAGVPLDAAHLRSAAREAAALLRALANEDRLLILCQLTQGELSVGEIEAQLDIRQPTLSQQLAVLRAQALVTTRRDGKRIFYSVADGAVLAVLACLYEQFCPRP